MRSRRVRRPERRAADRPVGETPVRRAPAHSVRRRGPSGCAVGSGADRARPRHSTRAGTACPAGQGRLRCPRSEEHTSELQSRRDLVCRLLLEKNKRKKRSPPSFKKKQKKKKKNK